VICDLVLVPREIGTCKREKRQETSSFAVHHHSVVDSSFVRRSSFVRSFVRRRSLFVVRPSVISLSISLSLSLSLSLGLSVKVAGRLMVVGGSSVSLIVVVRFSLWSLLLWSCAYWCQRRVES